MRSFYILIPTLAIANMGGINAQLQKAGAVNIRSGVVRRAIAITEKRQVHSADFSTSSPPSADGGFIDPLRSNQDHKGKGGNPDGQPLAKRNILSGLTESFTNIFGLASGSGPSTKSDKTEGSIPDIVGAPSNLRTVQVPDRSSSGKLSGGINSNTGARPLGLSKGDSPTIEPLDTTFSSTSTPASIADDSSFGAPTFGTTVDYGDDFMAGAFDNQPTASVGPSGLDSLSSGGDSKAEFGTIPNYLTGATSDSSLGGLPFTPTRPTPGIPGTRIGAPVDDGGAPSVGHISPVSMPRTANSWTGGNGVSFEGAFPDADQIGADPTNNDVSLDGSVPGSGQLQGAALPSSGSTPLSALQGGNNPSSIPGSGLTKGLEGFASSGGGLGLSSASGAADGIPYMGDVDALDEGDPTRDLGTVLGGGALALDSIPDVGGTIPGQDGDVSSLDGLGDVFGSGDVPFFSNPGSTKNIDGSLGGFSDDDEVAIVSDPTFIEDNPASTDGGSPFVSGSTFIANRGGSNDFEDLRGISRSTSGESVGGAASPKGQGLGGVFGGSDPFRLTDATSSGLPGRTPGAQNLVPDSSFAAPPTGNVPNAARVPVRNSPVGFSPGNLPPQGYPGVTPISNPTDSPHMGYAPVGYSAPGYPNAGFPYGYPPVAYAPVGIPNAASSPLQGNQASNANIPNSALPVRPQVPAAGLPLGYSPFVGYQPAGPYGYSLGSSGYPAFATPGYFPFSGVPGYNADVPRSSAFQFSSHAFFPGFPGASYSNTRAAQATSDQPKGGQVPVRSSSQPTTNVPYSGYWPAQGFYGYPVSQGGWHVDSNGQMAYNPGPLDSGVPVPDSTPASASSSRDSSFSSVVEELQGQFHTITDTQTQSGGVIPPKFLRTDAPLTGKSPRSLDQLD